MLQKLFAVDHKPDETEEQNPHQMEDTKDNDAKTSDKKLYL